MMQAMKTGRKRNVVFIIADDWDRLSRGYGNPVIKTPHIDRFAEHAVTFDYGFCTTPSCAASRACILTGYHSHAHHQFGHCHSFHPFRTRPGIRTLPAVLNEGGYFTGIVGKSHIAPMERYPFSYQRIGNTYQPHVMGREVDAFFEACGDQPFYLHVAFGDPHRRGPSNGFANTFEIPGFDQPHYTPDEVIVPDFLPDEPEVRADLADYYEAVSRFDHGVGLVLEALRRSGREQDTMVVVTCDHGMPFPGAKASCFDTGHRCPLLIYTPDLKRKGERNQAMVNWVDLAPTFYAWCGVSGPDDLQGRSFLPVLDEPEAKGWDETILSHSFHGVVDYNPYRIIRNREFKLVYHAVAGARPLLPTDLFRSPTWQCVKNKELAMMGRRPTHRVMAQDTFELFRIEEDPMETENLAGRPEYREVEEKLRQKLFDFCLRTNDPWMECAYQQGWIDEAPDE